MANDTETSTEWGVAWLDAPEHDRYKECSTEKAARFLVRQYAGDLVLTCRTVTRSPWEVTA